MAAIWVYAEKRDQTLELLNAGSGPAHALDAALVAFAPDRVSAEDCLDHGADEVLLLPPLVAGQPIEAYVDVFVSAAREADPDVFLVGATPRGKEIAARVAVRLGTGLCGGCIGFEFDEERQRLVMERLLYGGAAVQKVVCKTRPQMATIPPRTFDQAPAGKGMGRGTIRELTSAVLRRNCHQPEAEDPGGRGHHRGEDGGMRRPGSGERGRPATRARAGRRTRGRGGLHAAHRGGVALAS